MLEFNATFIVSMISFIVFIIIMNAIFYKPILSIIEERKNFIDNNYNDAKNSKEKAENLLLDKKNRLDETLKASKKIILKKTEEANEKSKNILNSAKQHSKNEIQSAKENLKNQENSIDLNKNIENLAEDISKKLLGDIQ